MVVAILLTLLASIAVPASVYFEASFTDDKLKKTIHAITVFWSIVFCGSSFIAWLAYLLAFRFIR